MINNFLLKVFEQMSICRHFEQNVFNAVKNKQIKIPVYLSAGQESSPATLATLIKKSKTFDFWATQMSLYLSHFRWKYR